MPKWIPGLSFVLNAFVANLWPFDRLCVSYWIIARPAPEPLGELSVSVVCPCRNEAGTSRRSSSGYRIWGLQPS